MRFRRDASKARCGAPARDVRGGSRAKALHKVQKALVLNTSMQPTARFWSNPASRQLTKTFKWMGVPQVLIHEVGDVYALSKEDIDGHHEAVASLAQKLIS